MSLWASSSAARSGRNARTYDQSISQIIDIIKVIADVEDEELDEYDHRDLWDSKNVVDALDQMYNYRGAEAATTSAAKELTSCQQFLNDRCWQSPQIPVTTRF